MVWFLLQGTVLNGQQRLLPGNLPGQIHTGHQMMTGGDTQHAGATE